MNKPNYSKHSTSLLELMLEPGSLHPDEGAYRVLIEQELQKRKDAEALKGCSVTKSIE